ncbi:hypothetical protein ACQJBY_058039 [Aegilops geniculata]
MVVDQSWNSRGLVWLQLSDDWERAEQQRRLAKDMAVDNTSCSVSLTNLVQSKQSEQAKNVLERRQRLAINNLSRCDDRPGGRVAVSDGVPGQGPKGGARRFNIIFDVLCLVMRAMQYSEGAHISLCESFSSSPVRFFKFQMKPLFAPI